MTRASEDLEERCRRIVGKSEKRATDASPSTFVVREMALLLEQLDCAKRRTERQLSQLKKRDLELGTQLLNLADRARLISDWQERTRMANEVKRTRDQVTSQIYRLAWESESVMQRLRARLLELLNVQEQLSEDYGHW